jgi:hypothetical protein
MLPIEKAKLKELQQVDHPLGRGKRGQTRLTPFSPPEGSITLQNVFGEPPVR